MTPEEARSIVLASGLIVKREKPKKKPKKKRKEPKYDRVELRSELPEGVEWITTKEALSILKCSHGNLHRLTNPIHRFVNGRVICYYDRKEILCLKSR